MSITTVPVVEAFKQEFQTVNSFWLVYPHAPKKAIRNLFRPMLDAMQVEFNLFQEGPISPNELAERFIDVTDALGEGQPCLGMNSLQHDPRERFSKVALDVIVTAALREVTTS